MNDHPLETFRPQSVGISDVQLPVRVRQRTGGHQATVATIAMEAELLAHYRERCVAEFLATLNDYQDDLCVSCFPRLLADIRSRLAAAAARVEMTFPYFLEKKAPVTHTPGLMEYRCGFTGESRDATGGSRTLLDVWVPTTTLCPCSKEISAAGAHNQRAEIHLRVAFGDFVWLEELIDLVEGCASAQVYSLLKRPDEKFVTEQAYANPMFVEDVVRAVAEAARADQRITWFTVGAESFESIHKHSAYAFVDSAELA